MGRKVAIIGCGYVGATAAYALMLSDEIDELVLYNRHKEVAQGRALDLSHGTQFAPSLDILATDNLKDVKGADIIVVTAGAHQAKGESRLDLLKKNEKIFADLIPKIVRWNKTAIYLVVSNPVDVCTYLTLKYSKLKSSQVIGSGTTLDSARLRFLLGEHFSVNPKSVHCYMLGEHGDSSFASFSTATIGGTPLSQIPKYSMKALKRIERKTKNAAYEVIAKQGATYYAIALSITELVKAILDDEKDVFPLSTYLREYQGVKNVCLSTPCVLGRKGIEKVIRIPLNGEEKRALRKSAAVIKEYMKVR